MKTLMKSFFPLAFACAALAGLFCSCTEHLLAKIPKTEFAPETLQPWNAPFEGLWVNPKVQGKEKHYKRLYIAPTTIDYLTPGADRHWHPEEFKAQAMKLAGEFDRKLREDLAAQPGLPIALADSRQKADLVLETAFVSINRTLVGVNLLSLGSSFFIPGVSYGLGLISKGDMAMSGRVTAARTGERLAVIGDYRSDEPTVFGSARDYTMYGNHRKTIDMWSAKLAELIAKGRNGKVAPALWFTLNPF